MKLQKLVYYAHGWCLRLTGNPLIDENFEAWKYGPVVSSVYYAFKGFGNRDISRTAYGQGGIPFSIDESDVQTLKLIERIVEIYGQLDAHTLSNKTHQKGSPWDIVYNQQSQVNGTIEDNLIKENFQP